MLLGKNRACRFSWASQENGRLFQNHEKRASTCLHMSVLIIKRRIDYLNRRQYLDLEL